MLACFVDLIRQLYSDGYITAEEASHLESKKLFEVPVVATSTTATVPAAPCITSCTTAGTTNAMLLPSIASVSTSTTITVVHTCDVSTTISDGTGKILMHSSTTNTATGDIILTATQCTTTELSSHSITIADGSMPQLLLSRKCETEPLQSVQCTELKSQPVNMATSEYPPESDPGHSETPSSTIDSVPSTVGTHSITQADIPVPSEDMSHSIMSVSHEVIDSTSAEYKSDVTQDLLLASIQDDNAVKTNSMYICTS